MKFIIKELDGHKVQYVKRILGLYENIVSYEMASGITSDTKSIEVTVKDEYSKIVIGRYGLEILMQDSFTGCYQRVFRIALDNDDYSSIEIL